MTMVRDSLPSLIQGISQQSPSLRPKGYIEASDNVYGTVVEGLTRRPTTDHLAVLSGITNPGAHHWIVRGDTERYLVVYDGGVLKVRDLDGVAHTVNAPDGWSYLGGGDLGFLTVNDYTYVYNRAVTVTTSGTVASGSGHVGIVWVRQGDYSTTYKVRIGYPVSSPTWYEGTFTTSATSASDIKLEHIQQQLVSSLGGTGAPAAGFSFGSRDNVIDISRGDADDYLLEAVDDATGKNMVVVKDFVTTTTDLPAICLQGIVVRVSANAANPKGDWWTRFVANDGVFSPGYWVECPAPGTHIELSTGDMPFVLINNGDGTFTFRAAAWGQRTCGGETYNPPPSFVGQAIQWMGALKGRIAVCAGGNFVTTRAGDPFNFWQRSVQLLEDSDPVDLNPSYTEPYTLVGAAEFQAGLLLFSNTVQFILTSGDIFGPKTVGSKGITTYALQATHGLLAMSQDRVCLATRTTNYTGLLTYQAPSQSLSQVVFDDTSAVVPKFMAGSVQWIIGSLVSNIVAMKVDGDARLFTYKESMDAGKIIQSAWHAWTFPGRTVISGRFIGSRLYLLLKDANGVFTIERLTLQPFNSNELPWEICLDRRADVTGGALVRSGATTTVTLPWTAGAGEEVFMVITSGSYDGTVLKATATGTNSATFPGLWTGPAKVGVRARSWAQLSPLYFRKLTREGDEVVVEGRLQLLRGTVSYAQSGPFLVSVQPKDRPAPFTEKIATPVFEAGGYTSASDAQTGTTEFPIGDFNDRVTITFDSGDSVMPMRVTSFEWKGDLHLGARPV